MAIHYDPQTDRFREDGRFVSKARGMRSRVARAEYRAAEAGRAALALERQIMRERQAEAEALMVQVQRDVARMRAGLAPGEPYIPPDARPLPGYPGVYEIPIMPDVPIPPPIETSASPSRFWDEWLDEFAEWAEEDDDKIEYAG